jgi:hypothetical protein
MEKLPVEKQKSETSSQMNNLSTKPGEPTGRKAPYCYDFQLGICTKTKCDLAHEINYEATQKAKKLKVLVVLRRNKMLEVLVVASKVITRILSDLLV